MVIVNSNSGEVISHFYEAKAFSDDAIFTDNITFDTARYQLDTTTRAFGIRFHQRNHSKYFNYSGEVLNLYYLQDKTLHLSLRGLSMYESYGEWSENCQGEFKDITRTIAIAKEQKNGFNSLRVNGVVTNSKLKPIKPDDCDQTIIKVKKQSQILKYNGSKYLIQEKYLGNGFNPNIR